MIQGSRLPLILVADDSPEDLLAFETALRKSGAKNPLVSVESGEEAITYLQKSCLAAGSPGGGKPDIVFLDVKMPQMGGFDVLRWIRRKSTFLRSKVIMMTSSQHPADIQQAAALGADGYLFKHPRPEIIASIIRQATPGSPACGETGGARHADSQH